jgi:plasmid replication initiation protein
MEGEFMNENYLVTKANTLITSNYDLSLEEQRVILTLASTVQPNDEDFKPYTFKIKDFMELLGVEAKSKYSVIPKVTKELMQKVLEIKQDNKIIQVAWLSSAVYEKGSGTVELEFSPRLKPFMLGLKEFYTSYRLKNVLELKGKYSIRMYEILKSNEFKKVAEIKVDELRKILKADTGSYLVYQNFRNRIILQAQKELNEKTDISFDFEEIKTGRKVTDLKFYIKSNKPKAIDEVSATALPEEEDPNKTLDVENGTKAVLKILEGHKIKASDALDIYKKANGDIQYIKKVYEYSKTQNIGNLIGFMKKMVVPGVLQENIKTSKVGTFNNYEQRKYDLNSLERQLLGWEKSCDSTGEEFEQAKIIR